MENPYGSSNLPAEPAPEPRRRQPLWRSLLIVYGVHHAATVLGWVVGLFFAEGVEIGGVFPIDRPWEVVAKMALLPPALDLYVFVEPFYLHRIAPHAVLGWRWLRTGATVTALIASGMYAFRTGRAYLVYVAIVSFVVAVSFSISYPADRMAQESASTFPGPGLVPARKAVGVLAVRQAGGRESLAAGVVPIAVSLAPKTPDPDARAPAGGV